MDKTYQNYVKQLALHRMPFSVHTLSSMAEVLGTSADAILFGHTLTSDAIDIAVAMEGLNATGSAVILKVVRDLAAYLKKR